MISIIVPVYKAERTIARCIESVIAQEYQDWELILVDDGSPDRSGEICDEYARTDIRIRVVHKMNEGASMSRNCGIKEAKGEYVSFVDSDDFISPQYLSVFSQDPLCDFEIQGFTHIYPHKDSIIQAPKDDGRYEIREMFSLPSLWYLIKGPCCKLFRKSLLDEYCVRFPKEFSYGEDEIFVLDYLQHCSKCSFVHSASNYFYTHENEESLTHRFVPGVVLHASVAKQYSIMRVLDENIGPLPEAFISFYRKDRAIDFYQSIYNIWVDSQLCIGKKIKYTSGFNKQVWAFIIIEKDLSKGFLFIRFVLRIVAFFS